MVLKTIIALSKIGDFECNKACGVLGGVEVAVDTRVLGS